ncbi:cyclin-dependent kinase 4 [Parasteatoda tepidariorum]|uniref:cyclin-dependent kinase 4 n=1 Tax=Parasteatoda tepidariorum TaxID=114398 RepID=UPI001C71B6D2|nr:cyclin-dependent kinase 4 isoform X1 [Parasteatoda tepidariorum]XP_042911972.1 cyclin-dependent kinase 4 isoform X2 [Parasteatoda tepidariorum]
MPSHLVVKNHLAPIANSNVARHDSAAFSNDASLACNRTNAPSNNTMVQPGNTTSALINNSLQQRNSASASVSSFSIFQHSSKNFDDVTFIGNGAYGTVYKARDLANNGQFVALKKVKIPIGEDGVPVSTVREISLLKQLTFLDHPNVVKLLDICHGRRVENERQMLVYLVFEHVDQDLATYLERCPPPGLSTDLIKDLTYQLLNGLDFLHFNRVLHRDLKPQNVLISNKGIVKLADFGLARIYSEKIPLTSVVVTLWYRPPEVLLAQSYATAVDVWSAGCIFAELYRLKPLFPGENDADQLAKIFEVIGTPPEAEWPAEVSIAWATFRFYRGVPFQNVIPEICKDGADLLQSMLHFNPVKRISCCEAMKHHYFKDYEMNPQIISKHFVNSSKPRTKT